MPELLISPEGQIQFKGTLDELPMGSLLLWILNEQQQGELIIDSEGIRQFLYFQRGFPVASRGGPPENFLGWVLREKGFIDDAAYLQSLQVLAEEQKLQGQILLEMGVISPEDLSQALGLQLQRKLIRLFRPHQGEFFFQASSELAFQDVQPGLLNPYTLIANGIRQEYSDERLCHYLEPITIQQIKLKSDHLSRRYLDRMGFEDVEKAALGLLEKWTTTDAFLQTEYLDRMPSLILLSLLSMADLLDVGDGSQVDSAPAPAHAFAQEPHPNEEPIFEMEQTPHTPAPHTPAFEPFGSSPTEGSVDVSISVSNASAPWQKKEDPNRPRRRAQVTVDMKQDKITTQKHEQLSQPPPAAEPFDPFGSPPPAAEPFDPFGSPPPPAKPFDPFGPPATAPAPAAIPPAAEFGAPPAADPFGKGFLDNFNFMETAVPVADMDDTQVVPTIPSRTPQIPYAEEMELPTESQFDLKPVEQETIDELPSSAGVSPPSPMNHPSAYPPQESSVTVPPSQAQQSPPPFTPRAADNPIGITPPTNPNDGGGAILSGPPPRQATLTPPPPSTPKSSPPSPPPGGGPVLSPPPRQGGGPVLSPPPQPGGATISPPPRGGGQGFATPSRSTPPNAAGMKSTPRTPIRGTTSPPEQAKPVPPRTGASGHEASPAQRSSPPPQTEGGLSDDEVRQEREIREKLRQITEDDVTHYKVLEVARTSNPSDIRNSYYKLSRTFHPDKISGTGLGHLKEEVGIIFSRLSEAYSTLSNKDLKKEYDELQEDPEAKALKVRAPAAAQAEIHFTKALVFLKRRDYKAAEEELRWATQLLEDEGDFQAALGWAIYNNKAEREESERLKLALYHLETAQSLNADPEKLYFYWAMLEKERGNLEESLKHFNEVLKKNPRHTEATREMRHIKVNMRREREKKTEEEEKPKKGWGFFKK